jgi:ankyrin repeat protein
MTVLEYMMKVAGQPKLSDSKLIAGTDADYLDETRLQNLLEKNLEVELSMDTEETYHREVHYQIAMCYFMGHGSKVNEIQALSYLASAAMGFVRRAMFMYTSVEASTEVIVDIQIPYRLLLCYAYMFDSTESCEVLRTQFPKTLEILRDLRSPLSMTICRPAEEDKIDKNEEKSVPEADIFSLIESEDIQGVKSALQSDEVAQTETEYGMTTLHALSLISDNNAATLAPCFLEKGADLSKEVTETGFAWKNRVGLGWGTPIVWSIVKGKHRLFAAFLNWCVVKKIEPPAGQATLFLLTVHHRRQDMLENLLSHKQTFSEEGKDIASSKYQLEALRKVIENNDSDTVFRRWTLGSDFRRARKAVAETIVGLGTDLFAGEGVHENPIRKAILEGDSVCVKVFMDALEQQGHSLQDVFSRDGILQNGHSRPVYWSALNGSVFARSLEAFHILVPRFPQLINQESSIGKTPLHYAASAGNSEAVRCLITHGASVEHYDELGSNALADALTRNRIGIARYLIKNCNLQKVLSPNPVNKATAFGIVLQTYVSGRKRIGIESFELLRRYGGLNFVPEESKNDSDPVWRMILMKDRPILQEHRAADLQLLEYLLRKDIFRDNIDSIDWTGRAAVHYAARYGYIEALKLFVDHGASINLESGPCSVEPDAGSPGLTAFDYALSMRNSGVPRRIRAGGARETKSWQIRMSNVLTYLVEHGAGAGSAAPGHHRLEIMKIKNPKGTRGITIHPCKCCIAACENIS